jgi:hypothetical protein
MTHSTANPSPIGRHVRPKRLEADRGTDPASAERTLHPVPVRGLVAPVIGSRVIRRMKADAEAYAQDEGIDIVVNKVNVTNYVNDSSNDDDLRKGLLAAWNLGTGAQWVIDTPADLATSTNPFHHSVFPAYQDFTTTSQGVSVDAFGGPISAVYKRGAPKLGSRAADWGKVKLGDTYAEYIRGLRSGGLTDPAIAAALLNLDESVLASHLERRAAAMLTVTVYLAEEWRKQGAGKIYRAILRLIVKGSRTFDDFLDDFKFIGSAVDGRKQVGLFYDVWLGDTERDDMDSEEGEIYDEQSQIQNEDYSSDDDMRTDDKKNLKAKRLFAQKHKTKK